MTTARILRVLVVEDEPLFRDLVVSSLERQGLAVIGSTGSTLEALRLLEAHRPDVALLDIHLGEQAPGTPQNGVQLALEMRNRQAEIGTVFLSNHRELEFLRGLEAGSMGGWSYLLKKSVRSINALIRAVEGAADGMVVLDPELLSGAARRGKLAQLTERQYEVLVLIAQGLSNAAIADQLSLSVRTIDNQTSTIYELLGVDLSDTCVQPRVQAVLIFLSETRRIA